MANAEQSPAVLLENSLESGRIHSAYLFSGAGDAPLDAAVRFARSLVCTSSPLGKRPCGHCGACQRSEPGEAPIHLDADGKRGPKIRQIGDHADLYWLERAEKKTRIVISQIRELQRMFQLRSQEGGWRVALIADAGWLTNSSENALLRLLEEPPPMTSVLLVSPNAGSMLATIRSRCVRVAFPAEENWMLRGAEVQPDVAALVERFDGLPKLGLGALLEWAEEYRGNRAQAAEAVDTLMAVGCEWLRERIKLQASESGHASVDQAEAYKVMLRCRRDLVRHSANPQMTAERGLFALRAAVSV